MRFRTSFFVLAMNFLALDSGLAEGAILRLNWQDMSSNESGFKIERLNGGTYVEIAVVAANTQAYSDINLTSGVIYCYRVRAYNSAGASAPTAAACATAPTSTTSTSSPTSPTSSTSTSGTAAVLRLNWQDMSSNESGFKIERLNGGTYVEIAVVAANTQTYSDSNLTSGVTYCYRVRAFNSAGASAPTSAACATAPSSTSTVTSTSSPTPTDNTTSSTASTSTSPALVAGGQWTDYVLTMKIRSDDNDTIGALFRYQDKDNYYRFSWFAEAKSRRLEKRVNGAVSVLAQDSVAYTPGRTYTLRISARGGQLSVAIDGTTVFSVSDASLKQGGVALYSSRNSASRFDDVTVLDATTGNTLLADNFADGDHVGWTIIDETPDSGPSLWSAASGALVQSSNSGSGDDKLGTYALYTRGHWADYRVTLKLKSTDDGRLGVIFRFQDSAHYYRFSWSKGSPGRTLSKHENGVAKILASDAVPYVSNHVYSLELTAKGSHLAVKIDGQAVFSVTDSRFAQGAVALYSSRNRGSVFDDLLVEDLTAKTTLLWHDFNAGPLPGWKIFDEPGTTAGPSQWSVVAGALVQSSDIGSDAAGNAGTYILY